MEEGEREGIDEAIDISSKYGHLTPAARALLGQDGPLVCCADVHESKQNRHEVDGTEQTSKQNQKVCETKQNAIPALKFSNQRPAEIFTQNGVNSENPPDRPHPDAKNPISAQREESESVTAIEKPMIVVSESASVAVDGESAGENFVQCEPAFEKVGQSVSRTPTNVTKTDKRNTLDLELNKLCESLEDIVRYKIPENNSGVGCESFSWEKVMRKAQITAEERIRKQMARPEVRKFWAGLDTIIQTKISTSEDEEEWEREGITGALDISSEYGHLTPAARALMERNVPNVCCENVLDSKEARSKSCAPVSATKTQPKPKVGPTNQDPIHALEFPNQRVAEIF